MRLTLCPKRANLLIRNRRLLRALSMRCSAQGCGAQSSRRSEKVVRWMTDETGCRTGNRPLSCTRLRGYNGGLSLLSSICVVQEALCTRVSVVPTSKRATDEGVSKAARDSGTEFAPQTYLYVVKVESRRPQMWMIFCNSICT